LVGAPPAPVDARGGQRGAVERLGRADGDGRLPGVDADDVEGDAGGEAEPLALADGEAVHAVVMPEDAPLAIANLAAGDRGAAPDELGVLARGDEADLLAVLLLGDAQAEAPCLLADGGLVERADGEAGARELRPRQGEQEVRVGLLPICR